MADALKLRAEDEEDLAVISSCLQDALVPLSDMRYDRAQRRFVLAVNRFRWEASVPGRRGDAGATFERIACGITFEGVGKVSLKGIAPARRDQPLELLAVVAEAAPPAILLVFAGGGTIRLVVDTIRCRLEDFGEPWPTQWRPQHRA